MTPEQKRIAIAEACPASVEWHDGLPYWKGCWSAVGEGNEHTVLFDPLSDLNAMHEAWCTLTPDRHDGFRFKLADIVRRDPPPFRGPCRSLCNATAAQRADAFLLTLGHKL